MTDHIQPATALDRWRRLRDMYPARAMEPGAVDDLLEEVRGLSELRRRATNTILNVKAS